MPDNDETGSRGLGLNISDGEKQRMLPQRSFCQTKTKKTKTKEQPDAEVQQNWLIMWPKMILPQICQEAGPGNGSFDRIPRNSDKSTPSQTRGTTVPSEIMTPLYVYSVSVCHSKVDAGFKGLCFSKFKTNEIRLFSSC